MEDDKVYLVSDVYFKGAGEQLNQVDFFLKKPIQNKTIQITNLESNDFSLNSFIYSMKKTTIYKST